VAQPRRPPPPLKNVVAKWDGAFRRPADPVPGRRREWSRASVTKQDAEQRGHLSGQSACSFSLTRTTSFSGSWIAGR